MAPGPQETPGGGEALGGRCLPQDTFKPIRPGSGERPRWDTDWEPAGRPAVRPREQICVPGARRSEPGVNGQEVQLRS